MQGNKLNLREFVGSLYPKIFEFKINFLFKINKLERYRTDSTGPE